MIKAARLLLGGPSEVYDLSALKTRVQMTSLQDQGKKSKGEKKLSLSIFSAVEFETSAFLIDHHGPQAAEIFSSLIEALSYYSEKHLKRPAPGNDLLLLDVELIPEDENAGDDDKSDEFSDWDDDEKDETFGSQSCSFNHSRDTKLLEEELDSLRRQLKL
jgi:hypothetical protein